MSGEEQTEVPAGSSVFYAPLHTILPSLYPAPFPYFCLHCVTVTLGPPADAWLQEQGKGSGPPWTSTPATLHGPTPEAGYA